MINLDYTLAETFFVGATTLAFIIAGAEIPRRIHARLTKQRLSRHTQTALALANS